MSSRYYGWSLGRRRFLKCSAAVLGAAALGRPARADAESAHLIQRVEDPPGLETSAEALDEWLTPNQSFFVRSHFEPPGAEFVSTELRVLSPKGAPLQLTLHELKQMEAAEQIAVLQCSGNGRALFPQKVPGIQWVRGAVGNARWRGVPLAAILRRASLDHAGAHVHLSGTDLPPHPRTPQFDRSIPMERALDPSTIVAFEMNGEPLPNLHGGPLRLVVPGWAGNHWVKWLSAVRVAPAPASGFYYDTAYRMPGPAGVYEPIAVLPVKSWITRPLDRARIGKGAGEIRGHALSGSGPVTRVEVSVDGGRTFFDARVEKRQALGAWQRWSAEWTPSTAGVVEILARATDAAGAVQPRVSPPNRSGYLWNGWDRVTVEVRS